MSVASLPLDVAACRARFSALDRSTAFLDAPGGTQAPDEVIDAMAAYLRESNANLGAPFETSRRSDALVVSARATAARFLGCSADEVGFGQSMTTLNFALSRTVGRELSAGDEIVVTRLDHDGNVAPWLELARDLDLVVRFADLREEDVSLDLDDLARQLTGRTRVVAFPWASNAVGSIADAHRVAELAHEAGALAWVDAVHYAPHGPIDVRAIGADVLLCSPYKFCGPHLGLFYGRREVLEGWRPYKVRPAPDEPVGARFETGTLPHEALAGFVAAVGYLESLGWNAIAAHERELGERFLAGLPEQARLHGRPTMEARTPTFALTFPDVTPEKAATRLAHRDIAAWWGDYYAYEPMRRLGLAPDGALRIGFVHYNTADEVDRVLAALHEL
ncbi:MAG TPA: cysteine desulfurase-like protein [Gaiellaceae bacterium]|nr:cysteine desulfurase-like protein [Gaiellaceae bacterium]